MNLLFVVVELILFIFIPEVSQEVVEQPSDPLDHISLLDPKIEWSLDVIKLKCIGNVVTIFIYLTSVHVAFSHHSHSLLTELIVHENLLLFIILELIVHECTWSSSLHVRSHSIFLGQSSVDFISFIH